MEFTNSRDGENQFNLPNNAVFHDLHSRTERHGQQPVMLRSDGCVNFGNISNFPPIIPVKNEIVLFRKKKKRKLGFVIIDISQPLFHDIFSVVFQFLGHVDLFSLLLVSKEMNVLVCNRAIFKEEVLFQGNRMNETGDIISFNNFHGHFRRLYFTDIRFFGWFWGKEFFASAFLQQRFLKRLTIQRNCLLDNSPRDSSYSFDLGHLCFVNEHGKSAFPCLQSVKFIGTWLPIKPSSLEKFLKTFCPEKNYAKRIDLSFSNVIMGIDSSGKCLEILAKHGRFNKLTISTGFFPCFLKYRDVPDRNVLAKLVSSRYFDSFSEIDAKCIRFQDDSDPVRGSECVLHFLSAVKYNPCVETLSLEVHLLKKSVENQLLDLKYVSGIEHVELKLGGKPHLFLKFARDFCFGNNERELISKLMCNEKLMTIRIVACDWGFYVRDRQRRRIHHCTADYWYVQWTSKIDTMLLTRFNERACNGSSEWRFMKKKCSTFKHRDDEPEEIGSWRLIWWKEKNGGFSHQQAEDYVQKRSKKTRKDRLAEGKDGTTAIYSSYDYELFERTRFREDLDIRIPQCLRYLVEDGWKERILTNSVFNRPILFI